MWPKLAGHPQNLLWIAMFRTSLLSCGDIYTVSCYAEVVISQLTNVAPVNSCIHCNDHACVSMQGVLLLRSVICVDNLFMSVKLESTKIVFLSSCTFFFLLVPLWLLGLNGI